MKQKNQFGSFDIQARLLLAGWSMEGIYSNAHLKCVFICPMGHKNICSWNALEKSFFCKECQDVSILEKAKIILAKTDYHAADVKHGKCEIQCRAGHTYRYCTLSDIRKKLKENPHCAPCKKINYAANIRSVFEESGWKMLEDYKGGHNPILCKCPIGHQQMKRPSGFLLGKGCQKCAGLLKKTDQEVSVEFAGMGWQIIGDYVNTSTPVECVCPNGHTVKKSLDCLRISPSGCVVCSGQVPVHPSEFRKRRNERLRNYREWTPLILKRDGYKCVICQSMEFVQAHHLDSYHSNVDKRYDIGNGVSLCFRHHGSPFNRIKGSFHVVYGFMNNTREQFEEYKCRCLNDEFAEVITKGKVRV